MQFDDTWKQKGTTKMKYAGGLEKFTMRKQDKDEANHCSYCRELYD